MSESSDTKHYCMTEVLSVGDEQLYGILRPRKERGVESSQPINERGPVTSSAEFSLSGYTLVPIIYVQDHTGAFKPLEEDSPRDSVSDANSAATTRASLAGKDERAERPESLDEDAKRQGHGGESGGGRGAVMGEDRDKGEWSEKDDDAFAALAYIEKVDKGSAAAAETLVTKLQEYRVSARKPLPPNVEINSIFAKQGEDKSEWTFKYNLLILPRANEEQGQEPSEATEQ